MQGIKIPLTELLTILTGMQVRNGDGNTVDLHTRVWNNQVRYEEDGKLYNFPKPAAFIEIISPVAFQLLGQGFRSADIAFRIHVVAEDYNTEGSFEQDLGVFDLRDKVISWLSGRELTGCSPLFSTGELQDYEHANVYHYIIEFVCNFTDSKGSRLDPEQWNAFIETVPPTEYEMNPTIEQNTGGQAAGVGGSKYIIPGR